MFIENYIRDSINIKKKILENANIISAIQNIKSQSPPPNININNNNNNNQTQQMIIGNVNVKVSSKGSLCSRVTLIS